MYGIYGTIELFMPASHSLKDRRRVLKSLSDKLRSWNISMIDASPDGLWQRGSLEFAMVSDSMNNLQQTIEAIDNLIGNYESEVEVISIRYDHFM